MLALFALGFLACTGGAATPEDTARAADTATAETAGDPASEKCAGVPVLTYANFGEGFLLENCQGCHASTSRHRFGAPEGVVFDTLEDAWDQAAHILLLSTGESPTMPPQGGVSSDDRTRLGWWLACGTPGT